MAAVTLTATLLMIAASGILSEKVSYKGYQLLSVFTRNVEDVRVLVELGEKHPQLDFWSHPDSRRNSTVLVPPGLLQEFKDLVSDQDMGLTVLSDDVQSLIDAGSKRTPEAVVRARSWISGDVIDHSNYHNYTEILEYLQELRRKYSQYVEIFYLNYLTHEGRPVAVVKLSTPRGANKPVIIVDSGIHAREHISPAANLWFMEKILSDYKNWNPQARQMLTKYDWYLIPVINPDGYEHTHTRNRMWRKNRRHITRDCIGVDLNRNFDVMFGTTGVDHNCESYTYPGPSAFSEPETANVRDLFNSLYDKVVAYVTIHSFGQFVLVPWGYTNYMSRPANHAELDRVTLLMTKAICDRHGKVYKHGTAYQQLHYAASGATEDWALTRKPGIIALCFELRPSGDPGFLLPPDQIVPTGQELYASLQVMAKEIRP